MDKISIHGKSFVPYITYEEIQAFIDQVADKLNEDYQNDSDIPILLCTLNGAMMFTSEIMKRIDMAAFRAGDAPGVKNASPNGFNGACKWS